MLWHLVRTFARLAGLGELHDRGKAAPSTGRCRACSVQHDIGERAIHGGAPRGQAVRIQALHTEPSVSVLAVRELRFQEAWSGEPRAAVGGLTNTNNTC